MPRRPEPRGGLLEQADRRRIVEAPRSGARRIEEPRLAALFVVRQVRVAEHHDIRRLLAQGAGNLGAKAPGPVENVSEKELQAAERNPGKFACVSAAETIDVPGHGRHRCERAQLEQDVGVADVAGVQDVIDTVENVEHGGSQYTMRVGDDADSHGYSLPDFFAPATPLVHRRLIRRRLLAVLSDRAHAGFMRRTLPLILMVLLLPAVAPEALGQAADREQANERLVRAMFNDTLNEKRFVQAERFYSPWVIQHNAVAGGETVSLPQLVQSFELLQQGFPDYRFEIREVVSERNKVVVRYIFNGTHRGTFMGVEPTNRAVSIWGVGWYRVEGGKIRETWGSPVSASLLGAIGGLRTPSSG